MEISKFEGSFKKDKKNNGVFSKASKWKKISMLLFLILIFGLGAFFVSLFFKENKQMIGIKSLAVINSVSDFLPIPQDERREIEVLNKLVEAYTKKDGTTKNFLFLLQNNMELRPGGGFLGQYAIVKIKDGEVVSSYFEDANLLDQRISAKVTPPYPLKKKLQIKNWKFRDSNWSPDFPTNVEKARYFYRLSGAGGNFDGVIAVNAQVFNDILGLTGPITVPGYPYEFNSENGFLKLEEVVEKQYLMDPKLDTQNRKAIMKQMMPIIIKKLSSLGNIAKLANLGHIELKNKSIMINLKDAELQKLISEVHWDGTVSQDWGGDYLMAVDANLGSLKTDYYIKRSMSYDIDLTTEKPTVNLIINYKNSAPYGDWRTSDYHTYLRVYAPKGSTFIEREMATYVDTKEDLEKTYFGFFADVIMGRETNVRVKYELPADFNRDDYKLLIQKQSGVNEVPIKIHIKTKDGKEYNQEQVLKSDLKFQFQ